MEELDKLKRDWQKSADMFPKFSESDLYKMLHKKSSSLVKWIFILSILEFAFWIMMLVVLRSMGANKQLDSYNVDYITTPLTIIGDLIMVFFLYRFYINYRKITTTGSVKNLMKTILRTRKTVLMYFYVNIAWTLVNCIAIIIIYFYKDKTLNEVLLQRQAEGTELSFYLIYIAGAVFWLALAVGIILLLYRFTYGLLLKRLHRNYTELKKIDL